MSTAVKNYEKYKSYPFIQIVLFDRHSLKGQKNLPTENAVSLAWLGGTIYCHKILMVIACSAIEHGILTMLGKTNGTVVERLAHRYCNKIALVLHDGLKIETAFHFPNWLCVSTQVGCPLACAFCETGARGFRRNLSTNEILIQREAALQVVNEIPRGDGAAVSDFKVISCSGMGEPLLNLDAVANALRHWYREIPSVLHLSTLGILPQLPRLFELDVPFALDLSLHATTDEMRTWLMPVNARFAIAPLLDTLFELNRRRRALITVCYMLLDGFNDSDEDLQRLVKLLRGKEVVVELKKYNPVSQCGFRMSPPERFTTFLITLQAEGIPSYVFGNEGLPINAGCGQLIWSLDSQPSITGGPKAGVG